MVLWQVIFWAALTVVLVIAEVTTVQFISVWFAAGALVAFVTSLFGMEFYLQVILFVAVSIVLLLATRPVVRKFLNRNHIKTNADSLIGKECIVLQEVNNIKSTGRVKVSGLDWAAKSQNIEDVFEPDTVCIIREIQGVTLVIDRA